jgi:hypothetical protein
MWLSALFVEFEELRGNLYRERMKKMMSLNDFQVNKALEWAQLGQ